MEKVNEILSSDYLLDVLSSRTPNAFNKLLDKRFREENIKLTRQQWSVLAVLWKKDKCPQTYLAEKTAKDNPGITRLLDNLEREKFIKRKSSKTDRRQRLVHLTKKSIDLKPKTLEIVSKSIDDAIKDIPENDLVIWAETFNKIFDNIQKLSES